MEPHNTDVGDALPDRLSDRATKVMSMARQEAQRFNHEYLGTEHILLGLVQEGSGVAANVLKNVGIDLNKIRSEVEKIVKTGPQMVTMGQLPFTPRAKKVLELSIEEASNLGHNYIGTEHLLLGLIKESEGIAAHVLINLGVKLEVVREEVLDFLGAAPTPPSVTVHVRRDGHGPVAENGDEVAIHYRAVLPGGKIIDDSYARGRPLVFVLSETTYYVRGFVDGIRGMRAGELRDVSSPPELAYGTRGAGELIPPNTPLTWTIELVSLDKGAKRLAERVRKIQDRRQRLEAEGYRSHSQLLKRLPISCHAALLPADRQDGFGLSQRGASLLRRFTAFVEGGSEDPSADTEGVLFETMKAILEYEGCSNIRREKLSGDGWDGVRAIRSESYPLRSGYLNIDERVFVRSCLQREPMDAKTINRFRGEALLALEDHYLMFCRGGFTAEAELAAEAASFFHYYLLTPAIVQQWILVACDSVSRPTRQITTKLVECWKEFIAALARNPNLLLETEWNEVEETLAVAFRDLGFDVNLSPMGPDGGKDIVLRTRDGASTSTYYVQVKHNRRSRVDTKDVVDFVSLSVRQSAQGAIFFASGGFPGARSTIVSQIPVDAARRVKIALGDRDSIWGIMRQSWVSVMDGLYKPLPQLMDEIFSDREDWFRIPSQSGPTD